MDTIEQLRETVKRDYKDIYGYEPNFPGLYAHIGAMQKLIQDLKVLKEEISWKNESCDGVRFE